MAVPMKPSFPAPDAQSLLLWLQTGLFAAINHVLASDPEAPARLRPHGGKTVVLSAFGIDLPLQVQAHGLLRAADAAVVGADDADLHITLESQALREAIAKRAPLSLSAARVRGDAELAQTVSWLLAHVRWDVEDDLAQFTGDVAAHRLVQAARTAVAQGRQAWERSADRARDWFASGAHGLVNRHELAQFSDAVRELRDSAARLDKHLAVLRQQLDRKGL